MKFILVISLLSFTTYGQLIVYNPSQIVERTLPASHYDTDFIYITNVSNQTLDLEFDLLEDSTLSGWHTSVCTSALCFNDIPNSGNVGVLLPGEQGYFSVNLSTNQVLGDGELKFLIYDRQIPEIQDTIVFRYHVEDVPEITDDPWVKINYNNEILTILLKSPQYKTTLRIFDVNGKELIYQPVDVISSLRLDTFEKGVYFVLVQDELGRSITKKIVNLR